MVGIIMDGKCNGCKVSLLEITGEHIFDRNVWKLKCSLQDVCDTLEEKFKDEFVDKKND